MQTTVKHRGKEILTTEFRCFANYPRLTQSHCSSTDPHFTLPPSSLPLCPFLFLYLSLCPLRLLSFLIGARTCRLRVILLKLPLPRPPLSRASLYRSLSRETVISQGPLANSHPIRRMLSINALKQVWLTSLDPVTARFALTMNKNEIYTTNLQAKTINACSIFFFTFAKI